MYSGSSMAASTSNIPTYESGPIKDGYDNEELLYSFVEVDPS